MKHASLFSGIGGFDLAASWMGWENVMQCEIDPFCQKILRKHFPHTTLYDDIKKLDGAAWKGKIDILTGGFPCQPFSNAGRRRGTDDNRFLWPEMLRVIREIHPTWIVAENVPGILTINDGLVFERVCSEMENEGYEVQPIIIPACAAGAPHRRDRIWFIANAKSEYSNVSCDNSRCGTQSKQVSELGNDTRASLITDNKRKRREGSEQEEIQGQQGFSWCKGIRRIEDYRGRSDIPEPLIRRANDGLSKRLHALGNAIVPQIAYKIFQSLPL